LTVRPKAYRAARTALFISLLWVGGCLAPLQPVHAQQRPSIQNTDGYGEVTFLEGMASMVDGDDRPLRPVKIGDKCRRGDRIRTGIKARLTLRLPSGNDIRFDEFTTVAIESLAADHADAPPDTHIRLLAGNAWVTMARVDDRKGRFRLLTPLAGVETDRGIFRLTVFPDGSAIVKLYAGSAHVRQASPARNPDARENPPARQKRTWHHLLKPMHQLFIRPNGIPTQPYPFTVKADQSGWVLWNRHQDERMKTPTESGR